MGRGVEDVERARHAQAFWGGWEYKVRWTGGNVAWEKGVEMPKGKEIRAAMEKARNRRRDADGFQHEIVQGSAKLRRACGVENEGTREATDGDMRTMWEAFAKYVEADGRDAGEMPTRNLGVITRQEGRGET